MVFDSVIDEATRKLIITVECPRDDFEDTAEANREMLFYIIEKLTPFNPVKVVLHRNVRIAIEGDIF